MDTSWFLVSEKDSSSEQTLDFQEVQRLENASDNTSLLNELLSGASERDEDEGGEGGLSPIAESLSFDEGFALAVQAIEHLVKRKAGAARSCGSRGNKVIVGIAGQGGSGKSSLAHKIACEVGCVVVNLENYLYASHGKEDKNLESFDSLDGALLKANLEDILEDRDTDMPLFDSQKRQRIGSRSLKATDCSVVILEGSFALHRDFSPYLDVGISLVGGVHYNMVKRAWRDLKKSESYVREEEKFVLRSLSPSYEHVEPHLDGAHIMINNDFDHLASLTEQPSYMLKAKVGPGMDLGARKGFLSSHIFKHSIEKVQDFYVRKPGAEDLEDCMRVRQCGDSCSVTFCEWIVEGDVVISPRMTFPTGAGTVSTLLHLGYDLVHVIKKTSDVFSNKEVTVSIDVVEELGETYIAIKGADRDSVLATTQTLGINKDFVTQSTLELCLAWPSSTKKSESANRFSPPPQASLPMRLMQAAAVSSSPKQANIDSEQLYIERSLSPPLYDTGKNLEPVPITRELSFEEGLVLAVRAAQKLREHRAHYCSGRLVVVGVGGPAGSGKSRLAQKMAELLHCEILEMEDYRTTPEIHDCDDNFDELESHDTNLLCSHLASMKQGEPVSIPQFDSTRKRRTSYRSFSPLCGIVIVDGVYALHEKIRPFLDFRIGLVGGIEHLNSVERVQSFREHIEPGLWHSHLRIRNDFHMLQSSQHPPEYISKPSTTAPPPESAIILSLEEKPLMGTVLVSILIIIMYSNGRSFK